MVNAMLCGIARSTWYNAIHKPFQHLRSPVTNQHLMGRARRRINRAVMVLFLVAILQDGLIL